MRRIVHALPVLIAGLLFSQPVLADRIDGDWCSPEGKRLHIDGSAITIPSGAEIIGDYGRHSFRDEGPEGDPEAGQVIEMRQLSEEAMLLVRVIDGVSGEPVRWSRCQAISRFPYGSGRNKA